MKEEMENPAITTLIQPVIVIRNNSDTICVATRVEHGAQCSESQIGVAYSSSSSSFRRTTVPEANSTSITCPNAVFKPPQLTALTGPRIVIPTI